MDMNMICGPQEQSSYQRFSSQKNVKMELPLAKFGENGREISLCENSKSLLYVCFYQRARLLAICDYFIPVSETVRISRDAQLPAKTSVFLIHSYSTVVILWAFKPAHRYSLLFMSLKSIKLSKCVHRLLTTQLIL